MIPQSTTPVMAISAVHRPLKTIHRAKSRKNIGILLFLKKHGFRPLIILIPSYYICQDSKRHFLLFSALLPVFPSYAVFLCFFTGKRIAFRGNMAYYDTYTAMARYPRMERSSGMFPIVKKRVLNETVTLMEIQAPLVARKAQPGQFIIFRID